MNSSSFTRTMVCALVLTSPLAGVWAQTAPPAAAPPKAATDAVPLRQEELDQMLAPLALYPDSLLSQVFMASTYPLEIVTADRWTKAHKDLKGDALAAELNKQTWDPSVKSLVNFPDVLATMSEKLDVTVKLGDAFIADSKRVMDSVQALRAKAQAQGNLKSTEQQKVIVEPAPVGSTNPTIIQIEPTDPEVIYVPSYNPTVVYGTWPYPSYPPYPYYPPYYPSQWVAGAVGFGVGLACGAAWGWAFGGCNWGGGDVDIDIDRNTNFNRNIDRDKIKNDFNNRTGNREGARGGRQGQAGQGGRGTFQHDPSHRQGVSYRDKGTAQRFEGARANNAAQARDSYRGRAEAGRQDLARGGASDYRTGGQGARSGAGVQNRAGSGVGAGGSGIQNRAGSGNLNGGAGVQNRAGAAGSGVQNRATPSRNSVGTRSSAFSGAGSSGANTRAQAQRGQTSRSSGGMSRPSGGGASRAGGGGRTGGGGGRR